MQLPFDPTRISVPIHPRLWHEACQEHLKTLTTPDAQVAFDQHDYPLWPLVGEVPLASAAVFDLGVMLTVTGSTMVALLAVARLSAADAGRTP